MNEWMNEYTKVGDLRNSWVNGFLSDALAAMHIDEKHGSVMMGIMSDLMGSLEKRNLEVWLALLFEIHDEIDDKIVVCKFLKNE